MIIGLARTFCPPQTSPRRLTTSCLLNDVILAKALLLQKGNLVLCDEIWTSIGLRCLKLHKGKNIEAFISKDSDEQTRRVLVFDSRSKRKLTSAKALLGTALAMLHERAVLRSRKWLGSCD